MASDLILEQLNKSIHRLVETGNDLLKPLNENPTSSNAPNPFVEARSERLRQLEETARNGAASQGH